MKRITVILIFSLLALNVICQGVISGSRTNWSAIRSTINENFDTIYNRSEYISISEYGAVGDGSTDNSTVIQTAIDSAISLSKPLYIPSGQYLATGLEIDGELTIFGNGDKSILFTNTNTTLLEVTSDGFRMYDLQIKGTTGTSQVGVIINTVKDYLISRVKFNTIGGKGIHLTGTVISESFAGSVSDCYFLNARTGIQVENRHEYTSFNNNVVNGSANGGFLMFAGNFNISGGFVTKCSTGIYVGSGTNDSHSTIDNVLINHNLTALSIQDIVNGMIVSNCQFHSNIIYLNKSKGVLFNGCEFGTTSFNLEGSESHFANSIMSAGNTINNDYNGDVSYTSWTGTVNVGDTDIPFEIKGTTDESDLFIAKNKTGDEKFKILSSGATIQPLLTGSLTDGAPTDAEIDAITGLTPATAGAGYKVSVLDNDGTELIYKIESDGINWQYIPMTK